MSKNQVRQRFDVVRTGIKWHFVLKGGAWREADLGWMWENFKLYISPRGNDNDSEDKFVAGFLKALLMPHGSILYAGQTERVFDTVCRINVIDKVMFKEKLALALTAIEAEVPKNKK